MKDSYASRASAILNKYKLRLGDDFTKDDVLARKSLDLELNQLKEEQELTKSSLGFDNEFSQVEQFENGGNLPLAQAGLNLNQFDISPEEEYLINQQLDAENLAFANDPANFAINNQGGVYQPSQQIEQPGYYDPSLGGTSAIPLATSLVGNTLLSRGARANNVSYDRIRPETISLARDRESAIRDAELARNINSRNIRGMGLSGGAAATLGVGALSDINRVSGNRISKSFLQEELANKQSIESANRINAELDMRETEANLREKDIAKSTKDQAIQNIISDVGSYFGDVQKAKSYNQLYKQLPGTTSLFEDPEQSNIDRLLFGQRSTIRQDPTKTKRYQ